MAGVYGYSALHNAVIARDLKAVHTLTTTADAGCSLESRDAMGFTPLHLATLQGNKDLVEMLVQVGCDINSRTKVSLLIFTRKHCKEIILLIIVVVVVAVVVILLVVMWYLFICSCCCCCCRCCFSQTGRQTDRQTDCLTD